MFLIIATGTSLIKNNRNSHRHRRRRCFFVCWRKEKLFSAISSPTHILSPPHCCRFERKKVIFPTLFSVIVSRVKFFPSHWVCSKFTFFGCEKAVNCTSVKIVSCCCVLSRNESIKVLKMCIWKKAEKNLQELFHSTLSHQISLFEINSQGKKGWKKKKSQEKLLMTFDMLSPPPLFPEQRTTVMMAREGNSLRSTQSRESLSSLLLAAGCKLYARIPSKLDSTFFRFFFFSSL